MHRFPGGPGFAIGGVSSLNRPHVLERLRRMTPAAVETEFTVVDIIRPMTIGAPASKPGLRRQRPAVTAGAANFEMCALQGKVRLPIVVELPLEPVHGVVAQGTILRETVRVWVAVPMAFDAVRGRVAKNM